jgi:hypothetical protein
MMSFMKTLRYIVPLLVLFTGLVIWRSKTAYQQPTLSGVQSFKNARLVLEHHRLDIEQAKADGKHEVVLPPAIGLPSINKSLSE